MPTSPQGFATRVQTLKHDLVAQGRRVQNLVEQAFEAAFARNPALVQAVLDLDEEVDRVDVAIEQTAVQLLADACSDNANLPPDQLRMVLTIVKVNNELERIADVGTFIAEEARLLQSAGALPTTFRVLANSVIGILRDVTTSLDRLDPEMARVVLLSESAVGEFKRALVREGQQQLSKGNASVDMTLGLNEVATFSQVIADHCTNIAEQVMYVATGTIVRHMQGRWEEVKLPPRA
jgi:phosphate transport system protein